MRRIIVIKVGSSTILTKRLKVDEFRVSHIASQIKYMQDAGFAVVLVISGAVASGYRMVANRHSGEPALAGDSRIKRKKNRFWTSLSTMSSRPNGQNDEKRIKQLVAGIGQAYLIERLQTVFQQKNLMIAQILLTKKQLEKKKTIKNVLLAYCSLGIIPILNENDVIELHSFGGNDILAGEIAKLLHAEALLILSQLEKSSFGTGGGQTKIAVVKELQKQAIQAIILNGKEENCILQAL